jgi:hypothetical protein
VNEHFLIFVSQLISALNPFFFEEKMIPFSRSIKSIVKYALYEYCSVGLKFELVDGWMDG